MDENVEYTTAGRIRYRNCVEDIEAAPTGAALHGLSKRCGRGLAGTWKSCQPNPARKDRGERLRIINTHLPLH